MKDVPAPALGAAAIRAALARAGLDGEAVDETLMGCVLAAGLGQAPARQAALAAGLPVGVGATTVNKMCGSGMKAAMLACDLVAAGSANIVVAGGMESMSNAPYLLERARAGYRMGHGRVVDSMFLDGLEDAYDKGRLMGTFAEDCAEAYQFTREAQDAYALRSLERAQAAMRAGAFAAEIAPVTVKAGKSETIVAADEQPPKAQARQDPDAEAGVPRRRHGDRRQFEFDLRRRRGAGADARERGGAARDRADRPHRRPRDLRRRAEGLSRPRRSARSAGCSTRPAGAPSAVDLYEINEAFAVVAMAAMRDLDLPADKVNVNGGACALGHPIGASGARILVTLIAALKARGLRRGVAALCIGGGEGTAMAVELAA